MKKLSLYIFLVLMWCNVGFAADAVDCNTLNECLDKGYVQIDKILFKETRDLDIIYVLKKKKSIVHCIVRYESRISKARYRGTYCIKP